jgi:hypothetical protein
MMDRLSAWNRRGSGTQRFIVILVAGGVARLAMRLADEIVSNAWGVRAIGLMAMLVVGAVGISLLPARTAEDVERAWREGRP